MPTRLTNGASRFRNLLPPTAILLAASLSASAWASGRPGRTAAMERKARPDPSAGAGGSRRDRLRQQLQERMDRREAPAPGADRDAIRERIAKARKQPPAPPASFGGHKLGPGVQLPKADLRKVQWHGLDLRGANLRGADLREAWLVDARLDGADLTGALLDGAILDGARLTGAKVAKASFTGVVGLDLREAWRHPFFLPGRGEVGERRYLLWGMHHGETAHAPQWLCRGANGWLFWIGGSQRQVGTLSPYGTRTWVSHDQQAAFGNTRNHALLKESDRSLWMIGDRALSRILVPEDGHLLAARVMSFPVDFPEAPLDVAPGLGGGLALTFKNQVHRYAIQGPHLKSVTSPKVMDIQALCAVAGSGAHYLLVRGERRLVATSRREDGSLQQWAVPLPAGAELKGMAQGPDGSVWAALAGTESLLAMGPKPGVVRRFDLPRSDEATGTPIQRGAWPIQGLCLGPDGNMWFTEPSAGRIGRCTPEGKIKEFSLDEGELPVEIISGEETGTLLFTLAGRNRIGSIRACQARGADQAGAGGAAAESKAAAEEAPGDSKAGAGGRSREGRQQRLKQRLEQAEAVAAAVGLPKSLRTAAAGDEAPVEDKTPEVEPGHRQDPRTGTGAATVVAAGVPAAEAGSAAGGDHPGGAGATPGGSATEPAGAGPTPTAPPAKPKQAAPKEESKGNAKDYLYDLAVTLPRRSVRHILDGHFGFEGTGKSTFIDAYAGPKGVEELLAKGLEAAGGLGSAFDRDGRRYTYCPVPDVGYRWTRAGWEPADRFVIITVDRWNPLEQLTEHIVLTAFPCSRHY